VEEFNRYNTRQLVIVGPDLKTTKISGVFSSSDPDSLLRFLRELPNISVEETGGNIRSCASESAVNAQPSKYFTIGSVLSQVPNAHYTL